MAVFEYKALTKAGRTTKGVVDAENERAARNKLKQQGIFPTTMSETREKGVSREFRLFENRRVSATQLGVTTRQLATLVGAGMPLVEALKALGDQLDHPRLRRVMAEVTDRVNEGTTLADALKMYPKVFPRLYTNMIASGEATGGLDLVLERLSDLMEASAALQRKVIAALTYPVLMLVLCLGVVMLLLAYVVPQITEIFREQQAALPLPTQIIISMSDFVRSWWWAIIGGIVFAVISLIRYSRTASGRARLDRLKLRIPLFGSLHLKLCTSRLARNLGTLLASGVELLTALSIVKNIVGNVILEDSVEAASEGVREGRSLAAELQRGRLFPKMLTQMIAVGEQSGQLESMLLRSANAYESEVNAVISSLTSILEPVLIIFLAMVVGCILAAVMLPMLEMSQLGMQ